MVGFGVGNVEGGLTVALWLVSKVENWSRDTVKFVTLVARDGIGDASRLAQLFHDSDERRVTLHAKYSRSACSSTTIGASASLKTYRRALYNGYSAVGEWAGLEVSNGALAQSDNIFVQCHLQGRFFCCLDSLPQRARWLGNVTKIRHDC